MPNINIWNYDIECQWKSHEYVGISKNIYMRQSGAKSRIKQCTTTL